MRILCLGLSHHTASVELRERLIYSPEALTTALAAFGRVQAGKHPGLSELVILSTCNRLELYAAVPDASAPMAALPESPAALFAPLEQFLIETHDVVDIAVSDLFYRLSGDEAAQHLCRVAAGLESMILGEPQILGQVTEAFVQATAQGASGPVLAALFGAAIHTGKRVRTETNINRNAATISSVAVKMAEKIIGLLPSRRVLIVGAGEMAELAVEAFRARGAAQVAVINRTPAHAARLAERWGARAYPFEQLGEALADADIVLTSTQASHFVITPVLAAAAVARRPDRPLVFIDIAVPRNVDPDVRRTLNAFCYNIDDLEAHLNGALIERQQAVPPVEAIVAEELGRFTAWLTGLAMASVIAELRTKADDIRQAEVNKTLRHLPDLTPAERQHIEQLAEALVNKLLHAPTGRLRAAAGSQQAAAWAAAAKALFALEG